MKCLWFHSQIGTLAGRARILLLSQPLCDGARWKILGNVLWRYWPHESTEPDDQVQPYRSLSGEITVDALQRSLRERPRSPAATQMHDSAASPSRRLLLPRGDSR